MVKSFGGKLGPIAIMLSYILVQIYTFTNNYTYLHLCLHLTTCTSKPIHAEPGDTRGQEAAAEQRGCEEGTAKEEGGRREE